MTSNADRTLTYLSLHDVGPGQGGAVHIASVVAALRGRGWTVRLVQPRGPARSTLHRVVRMVSLQLRALTRGALYVRHHPAALLAVMVSRLVGARVVAEVNGPFDDLLFAHPRLRRFEKALRWADRATLRGASTVVAVSEELAGVLQAEAGVDAVVVPNGVNVDLIRPVDGSDRRTVLFLGALAPWQGIDTLLDATSDRQWPEGVRLVIGGAGPLAHTVIAAAAASPRVDYQGIVAREQVPALLGNALAVASPKTPAHAGSSPLKVYESMAAGVPPIVTDAGQQADVVRAADCGLVVEGSPAAIASAVAFLAATPAEAARLGRNGRAAAVANHSWDAVVRRLEPLLHSDA